MLPFKGFPQQAFLEKAFPRGGDNQVLFTIDGVDALSNLHESSLKIRQNINNRDVMSFQYIKNSETIPIVGQELRVRQFCPDGSETIFAGQINRVAVNTKYKNKKKHMMDVECTDFNALADKRQVFKIYENEAIGDIILDVLENFMDGEGITVGEIEGTEAGVGRPLIIPRAVFAYKKASVVFDELAKIGNLNWEITYDKVFNLYAQSKRHTGLLLDENQTPELLDFCDFLESRPTGKKGISFGNLAINWNREQLMNKQWVIGGNDTTLLRQDDIRGQAIDTGGGLEGTRTFTLRYILTEPKVEADGVTFAVDAVKVNGVNKTLGVRDLDTGKDFYITKGEKEIVQDESAALLEPSDLLEVSYRGLRPAVVEAKDTNSINTRRSIERRTSGIYEGVHDDEAIESVNFARIVGAGNVRRFKDIPITITWQSDRTILRPGDVFDFNCPTFGVAGQFLVDQVSIEDLQGKIFRYTYTCLSGEHLGGWQAFFKAQEKFGRQLKFDQQQKLFTEEDVNPEEVAPGNQGQALFELGEKFFSNVPLGSDVADDCSPCWITNHAIIGKAHHCKPEMYRLGLIP